ncbi:MAG: aspartyl-tRNA amidotransferase subunit B [Nitrospinaceae bacterium]|nr:MAG: aspartyl-tRNA amidotransferase subunit B [Nitrospinaceae bacterium]
MSLKEILLSDMKGALKAKDSIRLNTIRGLNSEIKNQEIHLKKDLEDQAIINLIASQIKKRKEAISLFEKGNRSDLSEKEQQEIEILKKYMPEQVSEEDLRKRVQEVIEELGAKSMGDLGRIMKILVPEFQGKADNKLIKDLVGDFLGK